MLLFQLGLIVVGLVVSGILSIAAQNVQATFKKFNTVPIRRRMTGAQTARTILDIHGLQNVAVERVRGELTDHYDPAKKVLRLSEPVHDNMSVSAVGVAAHEAGHALQDKENYGPLRFRSGIVPLVGISSQFGMGLIFFGLIIGLGSGNLWLAVLGLILYSAGVFFAIVTLPVEFDASNRAMAVLSENGIVTSEEYQSTKKVLNAAAWTYVAAAAGAIIQLLYIAFYIFANSRDE